MTGLTLSQNQHSYCLQRLAKNPVKAGSVEVRLQGWEEFDEPVDRILSIAAFEAFRRERHQEFFSRCRRLMPRDGRMLLHSNVWPDSEEFERQGVPVTHEDVLFYKLACHVRLFQGDVLISW